MNKKLLILDKNTYFRLGLKTLIADKAVQIIDSDSLKEVNNILLETTFDVLIIDPSQFDSMCIDHLIKTLKKSNSKMITIFFMPCKYESNYYVKQFVSQVKYNKNISRDLICSLFNLIFIGLNPKKVPAF